VLMERSGPMMELDTRNDGTLTLVESSHGTKELALLLRKPAHQAG